MRVFTSQRGFVTLSDLLLSIALLLVGGGAVLIAMNFSSIHSEYLRQQQLALYAAQGQLEQLMATSVDTLLQDQRYLQARTGRQCAGEDANCNGVLDVVAGEDANSNGVLDPGPLQALSGGQLVFQIRSADSRRPGSPSILDIHVAACWQHRGRTLGEAGCVDGADAGSWVDSIVTASGRVAKR